MICSAGRPDEQPDPKKPNVVLRGAVGVWNCESSDPIKGCDGACIHAVGSLAGADGWSVTNVAAFPISGMQVSPLPRVFPLPMEKIFVSRLDSALALFAVSNTNCG